MATRHRRRTVRLVLAAATLGLLAGCGAAGPGGNHDDADVRFATEMVPHHQEAVVMVELAGTRAAAREVKELATQISAEQVPEIGQLQWMLSARGRPQAPPRCRTCPA